MLFTRALRLLNLYSPYHRTSRHQHRRLHYINATCKANPILKNVEAYQALTTTISGPQIVPSPLTSPLKPSPVSVFDQRAADPYRYLQSFVAQIAKLVSVMPNAYRNYWSSVEIVESSIVTKGLTESAPMSAPGVKVVGATLAVGVAGLALL